MTDANKIAINNSALLKGQQIVVVDSADYCPYCEKFKTNVVSSYNKPTQITYRKANELVGLTINTATWAKPTILFLNNGVEVFGHQGYMDPKSFYGTYTQLKFDTLSSN